MGEGDYMGATREGGVSIDPVIIPCVYGIALSGRIARGSGCLGARSSRLTNSMASTPKAG